MDDADTLTELMGMEETEAVVEMEEDAKQSFFKKYLINWSNHLQFIINLSPKIPQGMIFQDRKPVSFLIV